jgi:hypothetical protein
MADSHAMDSSLTRQTIASKRFSISDGPNSASALPDGKCGHKSRNSIQCHSCLQASAGASVLPEDSPPSRSRPTLPSGSPLHSGSRSDLIVQPRNRLLGVGHRTHLISRPHVESHRGPLTFGQMLAYVADLAHLATLDESGIAGMVEHRPAYRPASIHDGQSRLPVVQSAIGRLVRQFAH